MPPLGINVVPLMFLLKLAAAASYSFVVYFAYKLYQETDKGWYWLCLLLAAIIFAVPYWIDLLMPLRFFDMRFFSMLFGEISQLIGGILFGLACYGMYKSMIKIRKRVE